MKTECSTCVHWGNYGREQSEPWTDENGKAWNHCGGETSDYFAAEDPYVGIDTAEDFTCPCWEGAKTAS